jgi:hypothetical protein
MPASIASNPHLSFSACIPGGSRSALTRRQWWLGHLASACCAGFGFLGCVGLMLAAAQQFGLDPQGPLLRMLALAASALCLAQFLAASLALSRQRLDGRGEAHDLADICAGISALWGVLALGSGLRILMGSAWPLPMAPQWLATFLALAGLGCLAALVLECGVFEQASLTALWRGRRASGRVADGRLRV